MLTFNLMDIKRLTDFACPEVKKLDSDIIILDDRQHRDLIMLEKSNVGLVLSEIKSDLDIVILEVSSAVEPRPRCETEEVKCEVPNPVELITTPTYPNPKESMESMEMKKLFKNYYYVGFPSSVLPYGNYCFETLFIEHETVLRQLLDMRTKIVLIIGAFFATNESNTNVVINAIYEMAPNAIILCLTNWEKLQLKRCLQSKYLDFIDTNSSATVYELAMASMYHLRDRLVPITGWFDSGIDMIHRSGLVPDLIYIADESYTRLDIQESISRFPKSHIVGSGWSNANMRHAVTQNACSSNLQIHVEGLECWTYSKIHKSYNKYISSERGFWQLNIVNSLRKEDSYRNLMEIICKDIYWMYHISCKIEGEHSALSLATELDRKASVVLINKLLDVSLPTKLSIIS